MLGTRVRLERMDDKQVPPGTCGAVLGVDNIGPIMVAWDNGSGLSVVYGEDRVEIIGKVRKCPFCGKEYSSTRPSHGRTAARRYARHAA